MKVVEYASHDPIAPAGDDFPYAKDRCSWYHGGGVHPRSAHSHCHIIDASFPSMMAGLAAMVFLLILSMAVLVCCSWRIVQPSIDQRPSVQGREEATAAALQDGSVPGGPHQVRNLMPHFTNRPHQQDTRLSKVAVIMAGDEMPTFLAIPVPTLRDQIKPNASSTPEPEMPAS